MSDALEENCGVRCVRRKKEQRNQEVLTKIFHLGNSRSSGPGLVKAVVGVAYTGTESGLSRNAHPACSDGRVLRKSHVMYNMWLIHVTLNTCTFRPYE